LAGSCRIGTCWEGKEEIEQKGESAIRDREKRIGGQDGEEENRGKSLELSESRFTVRFERDSDSTTFEGTGV